MENQETQSVSTQGTTFQGTKEYVASEELMASVNIAMALKKPLLIKGDASIRQDAANAPGQGAQRFGGLDPCPKHLGFRKNPQA